MLRHNFLISNIHFLFAVFIQIYLYIKDKFFATGTFFLCYRAPKHAEYSKILNTIKSEHLLHVKECDSI